MNKTVIGKAIGRSIRCQVSFHRVRSSFDEGSETFGKGKAKGGSSVCTRVLSFVARLLNS